MMKIYLDESGDLGFSERSSEVKVKTTGAEKAEIPIKITSMNIVGKEMKDIKRKKSAIREVEMIMNNLLLFT